MTMNVDSLTNKLYRLVDFKLQRQTFSEITISLISNRVDCWWLFSQRNVDVERDETAVSDSTETFQTRKHTRIGKFRARNSYNN